MTSDRAAKDAARVRMARTGEPYSIARRVAQAGKKQAQFQQPPSDWHFVALGMHHALGPWQHHPTVRDTLTGTVTATVPTPPAVQVFYRVTSAGADPGTGEQLHVLAGQAAHARPVTDRPRRGPTAPLLYALRVDGRGQAADIAAIPAQCPPQDGPGSPSMAATPDGTGLLYAQGRPGEGFRETTVYLVNIATGQLSVLADAIPGQISEPSWAGDGRTLAFEWNPGLGRAAGRALGIYVVNAASQKDWDAAGRLVVPLQGLLGELTAPVISRDGTAVYVTAAQADMSGGSHWNRLLEVPVNGGEPRTLFELRYHANPANLIFTWTGVRLDPSGRFLLLLGVGWAYVVEIATATALRIPYPL